MLRTQSSLWLVDSHGSGLVRLVEEDGVILQATASLSGGHVAFITTANGETLLDWWLKYLTLPGGAIKSVTSLLPPGTEISQAHTGDSLYEATRSMRRTRLAWSPDGRQLAFVGAQSGTSADLYVYSLDTGMVTRLTFEPGQAYDPSWSPDGRALFFVNGGLYVARAPDFTPLLISGRLQPLGSVIWVLP